MYESEVCPLLPAPLASGQPTLRVAFVPASWVSAPLDSSYEDSGLYEDMHSLHRYRGDSANVYANDSGNLYIYGPNALERDQSVNQLNQEATEPSKVTRRSPLVTLIATPVSLQRPTGFPDSHCIRCTDSSTLDRSRGAINSAQLSKTCC